VADSIEGSRPPFLYTSFRGSVGTVGQTGPGKGLASRCSIPYLRRLQGQEDGTCAKVTYLLRLEGERTAARKNVAAATEFC
jgi:hypothetical protein